MSEQPESFVDLMNTLGASIERRNIGKSKKPHFKYTGDDNQYMVVLGSAVPGYTKPITLPGSYTVPVESGWYLTPDEHQHAETIFADIETQLAHTRDILERNDKHYKMAFVIGMHKERARLSPEGEDSFRRKIEELEMVRRLTNGRLDWELVFVAHVNSPDKSGEYVIELAKSYFPDLYAQGKIRVQYMTGPLEGKGGKVLFGMKQSFK